MVAAEAVMKAERPSKATASPALGLKVDLFILFFLQIGRSTWSSNCRLFGWQSQDTRPCCLSLRKVECSTLSGPFTKRVLHVIHRNIPEKGTHNQWWFGTGEMRRLWLAISY